MSDWRLNGQKKYLFRKKLKRTAFAPSMQNDHAHCSFCWEKFGLCEGMSKMGYKTIVGNWWICDQCFQDFKDEFEWTCTEGIGNDT